MSRRVNTIPDETLSQENNDVQDELLKEITNDTQENDVQPVEENTENKDNLSNEPVEETVEETGDNIVKGDRVKIDPKLSNDMLGRRIHNGLKNYTYTVLNVRSDGFCSVECLTHVFCVHKKHLTKI